ncbi:MAG: cell division protein ZipA C-terminal FtsZ-binding domain-containing protein [Gammaproteobacteria bacterium]
MELRDALLLVLASAVALVFAHGVWRAYFGQPKLKMKLDRQFQNSAPIIEGDELAMLKAELPNGGARVVTSPSAAGEGHLHGPTTRPATKSEANESRTMSDPLRKEVRPSEDYQPISPADTGLNTTAQQDASNYVNSLAPRQEVSGSEVGLGERNKASETPVELSAAEQLPKASESNPVSKPLIADSSPETVNHNRLSGESDQIHSGSSPQQTSMFEEPSPTSKTEGTAPSTRVSRRKSGRQSEAASSTSPKDLRRADSDQSVGNSSGTRQTQQRRAVARKRPPVVVHLHGKLSIKQAANTLSSSGWSADPSGLFHFFSQHGERCFTLVNLVEPGVFDFDDPERVIPGVSLILAINDVSDPAWAYRVMLREAAKLAEINQALMTDGRRQPLTLESIEAMAEELAGLSAGKRRARASA